MSSAGLNASLHLQLVHLATLVDQAIVEQHRPPTQPGNPAGCQLADLIRDATKPRPTGMGALLLTSLAGDELKRQDIATLEQLLAQRDPAAAVRLERLAATLEDVREEVASRLLQQ